jgi:uncharacterized protein YbjT (DUF2867 family)
MKLVVGGTGALGRCLVARLVSAGEPVRVLTRNPRQATGFDSPVQVVEGDLLDRDSLVGACNGCSAVFAAAHSLFGRSRNASAHVDGRGHRDLIDAARAAGVGHFIYTSAYSYGAEFDAVPFFRIKREVEAYLQASGLTYTIVRPTAFMESHAHTLIGEPVMQGRRVVLFGRGDVERNFVAADDVARVAVQALTDASLQGQIVDVGGPENLTNLDVVRRYERILGRQATVTHVPLAVLRIAATVLAPVHPGISQVLRIGILGDTLPQRFDAAAFTRRVGWTPMSLDSWLTRHTAPRPRAPVQA